ncbi:MAG: ABC transporter substrate-binding protein [Candidatus Actinomarina sp.]|jgi:iron complex transport system substrate-binding protein|nr:ABC transporter substrate-binding protein [Candidatus Actinomarina sp.]NND23566.1 ABC transporter substrate-binding protein [Acidimicrobiia bacterium]
MKYKILILAALITMCTNSTESSTEQRVVSLSTTHTEIIQTLGGENLLVGIDSFSESELPIEKIDAFTVTADELVNLNPDLVIVAFDFNGIIDGLEALNLNYVLLPPARNFDEVYTQIMEIGNLINKSEESIDLVSEMENDVAEIIENFSAQNVKVFHEIGYTYGIYTVNENSFIGEIYNLLGVDNIANFKEDPFGSGYPEFSEEEILMANPNLIIVGHSDYLNKDLSTRVGWEEITAIQSGNLFFLDENLANNWGTNTVDLLNTLSEVTQSQEDPGVVYSNQYSDEIQNSSVFQNNILYLVLFILIGLISYSRTRTKQKEKV